jgi:cellulose synthase/poly-beta-1,6-N-acetylglucosamine synthase-like glycosyltransferase
MNFFALSLVASPIATFGYAYLAYPAILRLIAAARPRRKTFGDPTSWPLVTITLPVYNEEHRLRRKLDELLQLDYPADRRHILVISDASTDGTDAIAREYADRGVELLRLPTRGGKSAAENAAGAALRGEIVVNSDATVQVPPQAFKPLIRAFQDATVGVASGRDVSIAAVEKEANGGEQGYVGYEMWVRALETRAGSIVGASGCFYGIRREIYDSAFPAELSRDFASALMARENGYRAVSVDDAICYVPRTKSLDSEFRRKIRTMARGLETMWFKRHLMNPLRHGFFAFALLSHKLARWLVYATLPLAVIGLALLAPSSRLAGALLTLTILTTLVGLLPLWWPSEREVPRPLALLGFVVASNIAGVAAWLRVLRREHTAFWEPTRRTA